MSLFAHPPSFLEPVPPQYRSSKLAFFPVIPLGRKGMTHILCSEGQRNTFALIKWMSYIFEEVGGVERIHGSPSGCSHYSVYSSHFCHFFEWPPNSKIQ